MYKSTLLALFGAVALNLGKVSAQHDNIDENGDGEVDGMGPAAFMWPPDRVWLEVTDNTGPCGSPDGPNNRTEFPMKSGAVALVQQDEAFKVQIAISYSSNPQSNDDFEVLIPSQGVAELDPGHKCLNISDPPSSVAAGSNATIQVVYVADWTDGDDQTFYACADITYVAADEYNFNTLSQVCFNATIPEVPASTTSSTPASSSTGAPSSTAVPADDSASSSGGGGGGLSGGAIAGIVVGVVVGVAAIGLLAFFLYRRDQMQKRVADHIVSPRSNVKWDGDRGSNAESGNSIALQPVSK